MFLCPYQPIVHKFYELIGHLEVNGEEVCDDIQEINEGIRYRNDIL